MKKPRQPSRGMPSTVVRTGAAIQVLEVECLGGVVGDGERAGEGEEVVAVFVVGIPFKSRVKVHAIQSFQQS